MDLLTLAEFEKDLVKHDEAVSSSPDIDRFCSGSEWILAAKAAWGGNAGTWIARGEHGYAAMLRHGEPGAAGMLHGLESTWGLACPLAGRSARGLAGELAAALRPEPWNMILLPGIGTESPLLEAVTGTFGADYRVMRGPLLRRWVASLKGGLGKFLGRRSAKLRANLKRSARMAREDGVTFEPARGVLDVVARAVAVEQRSWKGAAHTGLTSPDMRRFYEEMGARLEAKGRLRAIFARRDGEDVGYILGGVKAGTYRGFQFSFDARLERLSLGSLLQLEQISDLCAEDVQSYDLGVDLAYKRHWAETPFDTVTLAIIRANEL